jgi:hypothetical protein
MIKPPFTLLILKTPHRPVTVRVTSTLIVLFCAAVLCGAIVLAFGISTFFGGGMLLENAAFVRGGALHGGSAVQPDEGGAVHPRPVLDITGLFVNFTKGGGFDISFTLAGNPPIGKIYAWVVINPDSSSSEEAIIYPRSPVFRGLPLDFRNGIVLPSVIGKACTIEITEGLSGVSVERLRILLYSGEGDILADRKFKVNPSTGM